MNRASSLSGPAVPLPVKTGKLMLLARARLLAVAVMTERQTRQTYDFPETEES